MEVRKYKQFKEIYNIIFPDGSRKIATRNLTPGFKVYDEDLYQIGNTEYRLWDPTRSKLAAAVVKGIRNIPIIPESKVLYLGAASGTTPSHVSDIIGSKGYEFCVEFSARSIRDLVFLSEKRKNMIPILADARNPRNYEHIVDKVDVVYCDVAQPDQAKIVSDNANMFLKRGGHLLLAIKSRSISATKNPSVVYKQQMNILEEEGFQNLEAIDLHPLEKDHAMILAKFV
ncbi:MAG TPA: fibrillarin-like rRNA/tRNA 2'-O-methyltransferase [candidate division Zixibacteria bacterium]|nr:fibrillarin-like rRNA/tRNA 2'-O-methyltransferase [candidate division Zixibacteria bacterium]